MSRTSPPVNRAKFWNLLLAAVFVASTSACADREDDFGASVAVAVTDGGGGAMGSVAFPVSCGEEASAEMRLGLTLLHNMTYPEAEAVFRRASESEPDCALAYWGMAMTYLHPLWPDNPTAEQFDRGWGLLQEARARGLETPREEAYVTALEAYYRDATQRDETTRLATYADAWARVRADHPSDPEAALFSALALVATAPGAADAFDRQVEAGSIAEAVLKAIPDHPGAHHYVIHAFDAPSLADRALPVARRYGNVVPENSHALHMTSHIFTRRGLWEESIAYNTRAAELAGPVNGEVSGQELHAIDYLVYARLQRGEDDAAQEVLDALNAIDGPIEDHAAAIYTLAAVEARLALERHRWADAAGVKVRQPASVAWDRYPHLEAIPWFARALGAAHTGDLQAARRSARRLAELEAAAAGVPDAYDWATQVRIQRIGALAWITLAEGRADEAVSLMTEAAELEATTQKNPVTPGAVLPAGELLGDMLMELNRHVHALAAYNGALERTWNRFNSLYGAGLAAESFGDTERAAGYYRQLLQAAGTEGTRRAPLDHAEALISGG